MPEQRANGAARETELEVATLGGGCFWCLEPVFAEVDGVIKVVPGYAGGHVADPTYEQVCTGTTGHAEVVQITFDPERVSYAQLLKIFFAVHDPTTPNRQGADVGTQFRSVIFYHSPEQKEMAEQVMQQLSWSPAWEGREVVTELAPATDFYTAEAEHHEFFRRNPYQPYCRIVIAPKLDKFRRQFAGLRRED